jgi:putative ABC transport system substrate-binding protein
VFANGGDPVADGVVSGLSRPDGNITGVTFFSNVLVAKRLELLRELKPTAVIAVLINPTNARANRDAKDVQEAARAIGQQIIVLNASSDDEIDLAFAGLLQGQAGALLINADGFFRTRTNRLISLAARHSLPAVYSDRDATFIGGLIATEQALWMGTVSLASTQVGF